MAFWSSNTNEYTYGKEQHMEPFRKITVGILAVVLLAGVAGVVPGFRPLAELQAVAQAAGDPHALTFDVACDCRMGSPAFFGGNRGDAWIISGKIFPAGALPPGSATNDPILPVNGVAPIGEWTCRGQSASPFPPSVGAAYDNSPFAFNAQYFILKDGSALTVEGYAFLENGVPVERLSLTGGIGGFSGAAGYVTEGPIQQGVFGTNATGCPNFRAKFVLQPGSMRGASKD
jgi:hypothetical protein